MTQRHYKKMAGTAAVFVFEDNGTPSPVERDGMRWTAEELHLPETLIRGRRMPAMANALSLEGLEDYDPPMDGDIRSVNSLKDDFTYLQRTKSWVQCTQ